ncbi:Hypothetical_protein [Hexamita inflata]|uniref:Hypothetical_protein n=1 Tax=Hexamita inflata TaxID=28002 RepID=A0AA86TK43_9EUKA|nr:Hypothetical protein HINF_LOCUS8834 [Hexamita inflata]
MLQSVSRFVRNYQLLQIIMAEHDLLNLICTNFQQQLLGELFQSSLPYRVHSRANSCFMTFLELSTSKRSFVNCCKQIELMLQTNYEPQCFQIFRKTLQADNTFQNLDVCKYLQQYRLDFVMIFKKFVPRPKFRKQWRSLKPMNSLNPKIHFLRFQKTKKDELAQIDYSRGD